jgi:transposase-like protein
MTGETVRNPLARAEVPRCKDLRMKMSTNKPSAIISWLLQPRSKTLDIGAVIAYRYVLGGFQVPAAVHTASSGLRILAKYARNESHYICTLCSTTYAVVNTSTTVALGPRALPGSP